MFGYNWSTLLIILLIILILFGPRRLPELGESIGRAIRSFKKAHEDPDQLTRTEEGAAGGQAQTASCPNCQKPLSTDFAFCPHCGHKLKA